MNLEDYPAESAEPKKKDYSLCDRWILDRLNRTVTDVTKQLDEYRFNEAAGMLYHFIWHELCDWYLELIKPVLYGKDKPKERYAAQHTLITVFKSTVKLLHPIMPFVTEEIWQKLAKDATSVMVSPFPRPDESMDDPEAAKQMQLVMDVISSIRNIRGEMNILPSRKVNVLISAPDAGTVDLLKRSSEYVVTMARVESLSIEGKVEEPKGVATAVAGAVKVFVYLEGTVDIEGEKARLEKDILKLTKEFNVVSRKLANSDFRTKAAEAVIRKEENKFQELSGKLNILGSALEKLKKIK
jgi:valyl-tRNA synthetase